MNFWYHLCESRLPLTSLQRSVQGLEHYLGSNESSKLQELKTLIEQKDTLDYHYALQRVLKGWLFIHIPLSMVFMLLLVLHIVLALSF